MMLLSGYELLSSVSWDNVTFENKDSLSCTKGGVGVIVPDFLCK